MLRCGPEEVISLERVAAEEEDGEESVGEGTGSTELSDIRLLGRYGRVRWIDKQTETEGAGYIINHKQLSNILFDFVYFLAIASTFNKMEVPP